MSEDNQTILSRVGGRILRPLVRILLRNGIACGQFEEMVRKAYVDECYNEARRSGDKASISSVSAQTGLSRKEVKRLHEIEDSGQHDDSGRYNRAVRVISGWLNDRRFSSSEGVAMPLKLDDGDTCFAQLVKDYSGDIPTVAMLKSLQAAGCVEQRDDSVLLVKHAYLPGNDSTEFLNILGTDAHQLINTIDHNLTCATDERHFQRKVSETSLRVSDIPEFHRLVRQQGQSLLETLDSWLGQHQATDDEDSRYVSLSIFYFEQDPSREDAS